MSTCNQSAPLSIVSEHAAPRAAKSAERIDGAMMADRGMIRMVNLNRFEILLKALLEAL